MPSFISVDTFPWEIFLTGAISIAVMIASNLFQVGREKRAFRQRTRDLFIQKRCYIFNKLLKRTYRVYILCVDTDDAAQFTKNFGEFLHILRLEVNASAVWLGQHAYNKLTSDIDKFLCTLRILEASVETLKTGNQANMTIERGCIPEPFLKAMQESRYQLANWRKEIIAYAIKYIDIDTYIGSPDIRPATLAALDIHGEALYHKILKDDERNPKK